VAAIFVAAAAAVPNIATKAAARPTSFIFIAVSNPYEGGPSAVTDDVTAWSRVEGQPS
jgi:hypothetical protein